MTYMFQLNTMLLWLKREHSVNEGEKLKMKTFAVTICRHDVGHDEQTHALSHWGKTEQQTTVRPQKATNEKLCQASVWHDEREEMKRKWDRERNGLSASNGLPDSNDPLSLPRSNAPTCVGDTLFFARRNGDGPVCRVTGDSAAENGMAWLVKAYPTCCLKKTHSAATEVFKSSMAQMPAAFHLIYRLDLHKGCELNAIN